MMLKEQLLEAVRRTRRYAGSFDWPDRRLKEIGVVEVLLRAAGYTDTNPIRNLRSPDKDPPDVVGTDAAGREVAFEVTELVDEDAARMNAQLDREEEAKRFIAAGIDPERAHKLASMQGLVRVWEPSEVIETVQRILTTKDEKTWHGGPYPRVVLAIHTDEPALAPADYVSAFESHPFEKPTVITDAYVLFSYDPASEAYPVARLSFEADPS